MKKLLIIFYLLPFLTFGQCDTVTNIVIGNIGTISATINFTASGTAYQYYVAVKDTITNVTQYSITTTSTTINASGLIPNKRYGVYVTTFCDSSGSTITRTNTVRKFTTLSTLIYTPMTAAGYQYKYLLIDSGLTVPYRPLTLGRGSVRQGNIQVNTADNKFYGWNGTSWVLLDNNILDSAVVLITKTGDSLRVFYNTGDSAVFSVGSSGLDSALTNFTVISTDTVRFDYSTGSTKDLIFYSPPLNDSAWMLGGNTGVTDNSLGTKDAVSLNVITNDSTRLKIDSIGDKITFAGGNRKVIITAKVDSANADGNSIVWIDSQNKWHKGYLAAGIDSARLADSTAAVRSGIGLQNVLDNNSVLNKANTINGGWRDLTFNNTSSTTINAQTSSGSGVSQIIGLPYEVDLIVLDSANYTTSLQMSQGRLYLTGADPTTLSTVLTVDYNGAVISRNSGTDRNIVTSVNGNFANAAGQVTVSTGGGGSGLQHVVAAYGLANVTDSTLRADTSQLATLGRLLRDSTALKGMIDTKYSSSDTGRLQTQLATGGSLNKVSDSLQVNINAKQGTITFSTNNRGGLSTFAGNALNIPNYVAATGDSMSYTNYPNQTLVTPAPTSGVNVFDSSGRLYVRTSLWKSYSFSTSNLANSQAVIDTIPNYSGTFVMKYQADDLFDKTIRNNSTWQGNKIGLLYGGTNADLSATGGSKQVLQQATSGAAITVSGIDSSYLTGMHTENYFNTKYATSAFSSIPVSGQTTVTANSATTALTFVAGTNTTITTDNTAKSITINSTAPTGATTLIPLQDFTTTVQNSGTSETDIYTYTIPSATITTNGQKIIAKYGGSFNDVTATSQVQVYFGGTNIYNSGGLSLSATGAFEINASILRTGTTTARATVTLSTPTASSVPYAIQTDLTGLDFTATNIIKLTATASGATGGSNDISGKLGFVNKMFEQGSGAAAGSGITTLNSQTGITQTFATGTTGTDFGISSTSNVHTFNFPNVSATNRGLVPASGGTSRMVLHGDGTWKDTTASEVPLTFSTGLTRSTNTITNNLVTGLAGGQTVIGGTASAENLILSSTSNATKGYIGITNAPRATANYGSLSIGSGAFDGSTSGFYTGSANGTHIAVNAITGYTGNLIDLQKNGVSQFKVDNAGVITGVGTNLSGTAASLNAGTAATLTTSRNINGTAFNGSADVTVTAAAGTLTGTTLNSTVVTSSLTGVGTITTGTWNGNPTDPSLNIYADLGGVVKAEPFDFRQITGTPSALVDGTMRFFAINLKKAQTLTGIKFWQGVQGDYTADNYNGVGLCTYSGGTMTLVASSTDDGAIWKGTANTWQTKAFSGTYSAAAGTYFIYLLYNSSAQVTAPTIGSGASMTNAGLAVFDFTNSARISGSVSGRSTLPSTQAMSGTSASVTTFYGGVY